MATKGLSPTYQQVPISQTIARADDGNIILGNLSSLFQVDSACLLVSYIFYEFWLPN